MTDKFLLVNELFVEGQTTVTGGTSFGVRCFRITGDANNPVKQPVYNAVSTIQDLYPR